MAYRNVPVHRRSGVYTPTLAIVANLDAIAVASEPFTYVVADRIVQVAGKLDIDPTAAALTSWTLTLPPGLGRSVADADVIAGLLITGLGEVGGPFGDSGGLPLFSYTAAAVTATVGSVWFQYAMFPL